MRRIELHSEIRPACKAVECFQLMVSNVLRPGDGIGIRVGLRSQILGVRVSSGAPIIKEKILHVRHTCTNHSQGCYF